MGNKSHIRFVDAHTESDGGDNDDAVFIDEAFLIFGAHRIVEPSVIWQCRPTESTEPRRCFLDLVSSHAIDDARRARMFGLKELLKLAARIVFGDDPVTDIGSVKPRDELARVFEPETFYDVVLS